MGKSGLSTHEVMLRGDNPLTIDEKGRMVMPTRYRERLQEACEGKLVVTADQPECLLIYPFPDWEEIERRLMRLPNTDPKIRELQRKLVGRATEVQLDGHGRLLLPQTLRKRANLTRDAILIGQGIKFELWDEARWNSLEDGWGEAGPAAASELSSHLQTFSY